VQKSAKKHSFLPSFLAKKHISPIKSHFLLPQTTPFLKISLKNPYFHLFSDFFSLFLPPFSFFTLSILAAAAVFKSTIETCPPLARLLCGGSVWRNRKSKIENPLWA
jgi:hypothetical protein